MVLFMESFPSFTLADPTDQQPLARLAEPEAEKGKKYALEHLPQLLLDHPNGVVILVFLPWPEESFEAILLLAGHDVDVEMRHALAHAVVDGDKGTFRAQRRLHGLGE